MMTEFAILTAQYLYLLVLAIAAAFFLSRPREIRKSALLCAGVILPLSFALSLIGGYIYSDPRPFVVGHFPPLIPHEPDNGFPSDHVLLTGAIAALMFFYDRRWSALMWILALLIGWARVYAGLHHVADIVGSVAIVLAAAASYWVMLGRRLSPRRPR
jgi:undecaprenyl-diphosphatase